MSAFDPRSLIIHLCKILSPFSLTSSFERFVGFAPSPGPRTLRPQWTKKQRKKRDARYNHGRGLKPRPRWSSIVSGITRSVRVRWRGQCSALPPQIEVAEHVVYHGCWSACGKLREAPLDVSQQVLGQGRLGVKITGVIAYLCTVMRLPVRQIKAYLKTLHGLLISVGEIVEVSHRLTKEMQPT